MDNRLLLCEEAVPQLRLIQSSQLVFRHQEITEITTLNVVTKHVISTSKSLVMMIMKFSKISTRAE